MPQFNATRYGYSKGNLADGFQGRPDLSVYGQAIKESQNFHSGTDGVMRFRKGFENVIVSAPKSDSSNSSTGTVKTLAFFSIGTASVLGRWIFVDFCKDKTTGKFSTIYARDEGLGYMPIGVSSDPLYVEPTIASSTADGELTLSGDLLDELHREGTFINYILGGTRYPALISKAESGSKDEITIVQTDGQAYTALPDLTGSFIEVMGSVLNTPIEPDFDWVQAENALYIVDGTTRYRFRVTPGGGSLVIVEDFAIVDNPFPIGDAPSTVGLHQNRLTFGGFKTEPALIVLSELPISGAGDSKYDNFSTGTLATDAVVIYMNPSNLTPITEVKWLKSSSRALLVGVNDGVAEITSVGLGVTPTDVDVSVFSFKDPAAVKPVAFDNFVNWVSLDGDKIYESAFALDFDADISYSVSVLTDIKSNINQIVSFNGKEQGLFVLLENGDMLLGIRSDNRRVSFFPVSFLLGEATTPGETILSMETYSSSEGQVLDLNVVIPDLSGAVTPADEYKIIRINIDTFLQYGFLYLRSELFPYMDHYNDVVATFFNGVRDLHLDDGHSYSETVEDTISGTGTFLILNESDDDDYDLKVTSDTGVLLADKQIAIPELGIVIEYVLEINATGDFYADYVISDANLGDYDLAASPIKLSGARLANMYVNFSSFNISTNSKISSDAVVMADGTVVDVTPVEAAGDYGYYTITLDNPAFFAHVGLKYSGMFTMLPLTPSGSGQLGYNRPKSIAELKIRLMNSGDGTVYINRISETVFEFEDDWVFDWKRYYNDIFSVRPQSSWDEKTEITFFQKEPQPLNISFMDIFEDVTVE